MQHRRKILRRNTEFGTLDFASGQGNSF